LDSEGLCTCFAKGAEGLVFCEPHHRYWFGGHRVPSVTTILKPLDNFDGVDPEVLEAARLRGIAVHSATQYDDDGDLDMGTVDDMIRPYLLAWRKFKGETGFETILSEHRVMSTRYRYAGTLDRIGLLGGRQVLLDIKTGEQVPLSAGPQTAAYLEAFNAAYPPPAGKEAMASRRYVVQLRSTGDYQLIPYTASDDLQCFLAHLNIHQWWQRREGVLDVGHRLGPPGGGDAEKFKDVQRRLRKDLKNEG